MRSFFLTKTGSYRTGIEAPKRSKGTRKVKSSGVISKYFIRRKTGKEDWSNNSLMKLRKTERHCTKDGGCGRTVLGSGEVLLLPRCTTRTEKSWVFRRSRAISPKGSWRKIRSGNI